MFSSTKTATVSYQNALKDVQRKYNAASDQGKKGPKLALQHALGNLHQTHENFISESSAAMDKVDYEIQARLLFGNLDPIIPDQGKSFPNNITTNVLISNMVMLLGQYELALIDVETSYTADQESPDYSTFLHSALKTFYQDHQQLMLYSEDAISKLGMRIEQLLQPPIAHNVAPPAAEKQEVNRPAVSNREVGGAGPAEDMERNIAAREEILEHKEDLPTTGTESGQAAQNTPEVAAKRNLNLPKPDPKKRARKI